MYVQVFIKLNNNESLQPRNLKNIILKKRIIFLREFMFKVSLSLIELIFLIYFEGSIFLFIMISYNITKEKTVCTIL